MSGEARQHPDALGVPTAHFHDDRLDMAYWFPKLRGLDVPTPESQPITLDYDTDGVPEFDTDLAKEFVENLGGKAFLRSGYKHAAMSPMEGSYIWGKDDVEPTAMALMSQHVMMSLPLGESLWLREWLDLNHCNYARDNLNPELRFFIEDGDVMCWHPRLEGFDRVESGEEFREIAEDLIEQNAENLRVYAERVAEEFDGSWSVDFVRDTEGEWYLTDMALRALYYTDGAWRNMSEHPGEDCEHDLIQYADELEKPEEDMR
jgi:hypothetical protein